MSTTAPLTILREKSTKALKNAKGEPYTLHNLEVKSGTKGVIFSAVMFSPPDQQIELDKEKTYEIEKSKFKDDEYVIKEVRLKKQGNGYQRNVDLDVWKMALEASLAITATRDVASIMANAREFAKQLKKEIV